MKRYTFLMTVSLFILSCSNKKTIVQGLNLGMSEEAWKNELRKNITSGSFSELSKDSLTGLFIWKFSDTSIQVNASFNNDGIQSGKLRVIYFNLNNKDGFSHISNELNLIDTGQIETGINKESVNGDPSIENLPSEFIIDGCLKTRLNAVKTKLEKLLGKPDSVTYEYGRKYDPEKPWIQTIDKTDTSWIRYYFRNGSNIVCLAQTEYIGRTKQVPFEHYGRAYVLMYPKNYDKILSEEIESRRAKIKAKDILKLEFYTRIERNRNSYGLEDINFEFWAPLDPTCIKELSETRPIVAAKGTIRMTDSFGDILQDFDDFDFSLSYPIAQDRKPGLEYVTSTVYLTSSNGSRYQGRLNVFSKKCSEKLRQVILNNGKVNVEFIANSIKFSDGSILR